ncbi:MAG TPA: hypothetical protein VFA48_06685, partial [Gammaproteobacteria bacterium]|nr:hypothetical protein [Gammaproteobacteria bacterium]
MADQRNPHPNAGQVKPPQKPKRDPRKRAVLWFAVVIALLMAAGLLVQTAITNKTKASHKSAASQPARPQAELPPPPSQTQVSALLAAQHQNRQPGRGSNASSSGQGSGGGGSSIAAKLGILHAGGSSNKKQSGKGRDVSGGYGLTASQAKSGMIAFGGNNMGMKPPSSPEQDLSQQVSQAKKLILEHQKNAASKQQNALNTYIKELMAGKAAAGGGHGGPSGDQRGSEARTQAN